MPGAFKRSLENGYGRLKHLNQHISTQVLAGTKRNLIVKEDSIGLYFESKIAPTSIGKDVLISYERGDLDEHSIGFETVKQRKASSYNELIELKLWEGSTVTWGANEMARATGIKSFFRKLQHDPLEYLNDVMMDIKNGLVDEDDIEDVIRYTYKQLFNKHIVDLSTSSTQPAAMTTAPDPQTGVKSDDFLPEDEIKTLLFLNQSQLKKQVHIYETQLQRMALS
jgi:HK97 family phage prohead protease